MTYLRNSPYNGTDVTFVMAPGLSDRINPFMEATFQMAPGLLADVKTDYANRLQWAGRTGCLTVNNQWINVNPNDVQTGLNQIGSDFRAKFASQRQFSQEEINLITIAKTAAESQAKQMQKFVDQSQTKFQEAYNTLSSFLGTTWNYDKVLRLRDEGNALLVRAGEQRADLFGNLGFLMLYAPDINTAGQLCTKKVEIYQQYGEVIKKIEELNVKINEKESAWFAFIDSLVAKVIDFLQKLQKIIEGLVALLQTAFSGLAALADFSVRYPYAAWAGIGLVALAIGGIYLKATVGGLSNVLRSR